MEDCGGLYSRRGIVFCQEVNSVSVSQEVNSVSGCQAVKWTCYKQKRFGFKG